MKWRLACSVLSAFLFLSCSNLYGGQGYNFLKQLDYNLQQRAENTKRRVKTNQGEKSEIVLQSRETKEEYNDKVIDAILESAWEASEVTNIGNRVREIWYEAKDYSKVSVVGTKHDADLYVNKDKEPVKKEYEIEFSGKVHNYEPRPALEGKFPDFNAKFSYGLEGEIYSKITPVTINELFGYNINLVSHYDSEETYAKVKLGFDF